ncbi:MAG: thioredoxin [Proteobacteria bacterium]|nr:thioredoxin [Pseudomonadota bacterium]
MDANPTVDAPTPQYSDRCPERPYYILTPRLCVHKYRTTVKRYWRQKMATVKVTDDTFAAEVTESDIPVVVDFWAEWCGPCKQIGPSLEELSEEFAGKVKIAKVNVDENPNAPAQMGVRGIPALFIIKDGQVIANKTGAAPKAALADWINSSI